MPDALVERDGPLMIVTMNRPHRMNAQSGAMLVRLYDAWVEASNDDDIRCIIVTGAGGNFSSGADLKAMAGDSGPYADTEIDSASRLAEDPRLMHKAYLKDYRPTKPVIAAVEGAAIAGGTELMLGTDIRVAAESARFGVSEARWSLYPMMGSSVRLPRQIPKTVAAEILLTGKHITAREAYQWGLVGSVVPDGQAVVAAKEIAATICDNGPLSVEAILKTLHDTDGMEEADALKYEEPYGTAVFATEDAKEGPRAFAEKRKPNFQRR
jgi:enoyl-CoA hydratase/carnithine racemase